MRQSVLDKSETVISEKNHHQPLPQGSFLIMKSDLQEHWEHRLAKSINTLTIQLNFCDYEK